MALTQRLEFRQSQSLVMTPQLMQAIKLLQLSNLDLSAFVEEELERNPLLDRASDGPETPVAGEPGPERAEFASSGDSYGDEGSGEPGEMAAGSPATGGSVPSLARSSSGFRSSSSSTKAERSRFDSCSSLIACISCGVITSDWDWRNSSLCVRAIEARTDLRKLVRFLLKLVQSRCTRLDELEKWTIARSAKV